VLILGRLTGHIVGNGLSTEQEYSPASGHLYTIKSNFNIGVSSVLVVGIGFYPCD
jgi:hypothetical protein